ncbi:MAG: nuclear transport factor 2 family protein [Microthrixaceae bacterium]
MAGNGGPRSEDGQVPDAARLADIAAIESLAVAYAHAVDDRDWQRWEALFLPDAHIDYLSAGGIEGTPAELAAWMPDAMAAFRWCLHSMFTHEITFTGDRSATGRVHVFNRNGVEWEGKPEIVDVGAVYHDRYTSDGGHWRFAERIEKTNYIEGGKFADMIREAAPPLP